MSSEFEYKPNDISSDMFLSEIPLSLMKENIISQFNDPLEHRKKDHITTFIAMYKYSEENVDAYEDEDEDHIVELRDDFYVFIRNLFEEYLGLGFNNFEDLSKDDQDDLIHFTYRFFLINIKKNFISYLRTCIDDEKDNYVYDEDKKKDVTSLSFKKEVTDERDIYILSNLGDIIDDILHRDITVDDFLDKCDDEESCMETRFVKAKFDDFEITGNFVEKYIDMIDSDFKSEIESKIRNKILKKYNKKK